MAGSDAEICNQALGYVLSKQRIQDLALEVSEVGDLCRIYYPGARDKLLSLHPWSFARTEAVLGQASGVTRSGWTFVYLLPTDCDVPLELFSGLPPLLPDEKHPFDMQYGDASTLRYLVCDLEPPATLLYQTTNAKVPGRWTPAFDDALAWRLAADLAIPISGRLDLLRIAEANAKELTSLARAQDLNGRRPHMEPRSVYQKARE